MAVSVLLDTFDAAVKALGRQHADLDFQSVDLGDDQFGTVEPAGLKSVCQYRPIGTRHCPDFTTAFGGTTDMAGPAAGSSQSRMTRCGVRQESWQRIGGADQQSQGAARIVRSCTQDTCCAAVVRIGD
jgi:hypothetical protein